MTELSGPVSTIEEASIDKSKEFKFQIKVDHPEFETVRCAFIEDAAPSDKFIKYMKDGKDVYLDMNMNHPYIASLGKDLVRLREVIIQAWCLALTESYLKTRGHVFPDYLILNTMNNFLRELHTVSQQHGF